MDWKTILTTVLGAGLVSSLATPAWGWWDKRSTNKRSATYLAIRLAVILERFAIDSADLISDQESYDQSGGNVGASATSLPTLEPFPEEQSWHTLQPALVNRVLTFPNEVRLRNSSLASLWEVSPEDFSGDCIWQCAYAGYTAWVLARDLRTKYGLHPLDVAAASWDFADILKRHRDEAPRKVPIGTRKRSRPRAFRCT